MKIEKDIPEIENAIARRTFILAEWQAKLAKMLLFLPRFFNILAT